MYNDTYEITYEQANKLFDMTRPSHSEECFATINLGEVGLIAFRDSATPVVKRILGEEIFNSNTEENGTGYWNLTCKGCSFKIRLSLC